MGCQDTERVSEVLSHHYTTGYCLLVLRVTSSNFPQLPQLCEGHAFWSDASRNAIEQNKSDFVPKYSNNETPWTRLHRASLHDPIFFKTGQRERPFRRRKTIMLHSAKQSKQIHAMISWPPATGSYQNTAATRINFFFQRLCNIT